MESLKVVKLMVRNYLGIKAVEIRPVGDVIRVEGKNGSGKSSAVGSIWSLLGGKKAEPENPLRNGTTDGEISAQLGHVCDSIQLPHGLIVTKKFTKKGSYLEVTGGDGDSPQATLDKLFTATSFDPQAFINMKSAERCELLLKLTGKREQITALDREYKTVYDERTAVNRSARDIEGKLIGAPADEQIPEIEDKEKSVSELTARLQKEQDLDDKADELNNLINDWSESKRGLEKRLQEIEEEKTQIKTLIKDKIDKIDSFKKEYDTLPEPKTVEIQTEIDSADEYNADIRRRKAARENLIRGIQAANGLRAEQTKLTSDSEKMSNRLKRITDEKAEILSSAKLGVPGLTIDAGEIFIDGTPFDDLSTKERIVASMHIGISQNPKLRVLRIENGRELDGDSMKEVEKFAAENDCQIWIEQVSDTASGEGIFIEDGEIKNE